MASQPPLVFVHIGAMKTGTTFLQQLMMRNRASLAEHGLHFPGRAWPDQARAAHDVLRLRWGRRWRAPYEGTWPRLAEEMLAHDSGASVFSAEFLSFAGPAAARRLVAGLPGAQVHLVLTVRDTGLVLPSLWQTHSANGGTASWPDFARSARAGAGRGAAALALGQGARIFRNALDVPRMLRTWGRLVAPERVHVVTVPPPGSPPRLLWERFASVIGVDPGACPQPPRRSNPSLGYPSADLLRRMNARLGRLPRSDYDPTIRRYLVREVLLERVGVEERPGLDEPTAALAARWNERVRAAIERSGARLVGDLDDLPLTVPPTVTGGLTLPGVAPTLAAASTAVEGMQDLVERRTAKVRRRAAAGVVVRGAEPPALSAEQSLARWQSAPDPVDTAVADVVALTRRAIELHRR